MANLITGSRNREMFVAFLNGTPKAELAIQYGLAINSVNAILRIERHKLAVSPQLQYRQLRDRYGNDKYSSVSIVRSVSS